MGEQRSIDNVTDVKNPNMSDMVDHDHDGNPLSQKGHGQGILIMDHISQESLQLDPQKNDTVINTASYNTRINIDNHQLPTGNQGHLKVDKNDNQFGTEQKQPRNQSMFREDGNNEGHLDKDRKYVGLKSALNSTTKVLKAPGPAKTKNEKSPSQIQKIGLKTGLKANDAARNASKQSVILQSGTDDMMDN